MACEVISGKIRPPGGVIYENEYWMVNHSVPCPIILMRGFLIIQPKRHCEHLAELTIEETLTFAPLLRNTCLALSRVVQPAKVYACSLGESLKHIHYCIIPRYPEMPADGVEVLLKLMREKVWACSEAEAAELATKVKQEFYSIQN